MSTLERIEQDIKTAMLAGDQKTVITLRMVKGAIQNEEVAKRGSGATLSEDDISRILFKEAKKRQESAQLYAQAKEEQREQSELEEKKIIENYLPKAMSEEELTSVIKDAVAQIGATEQKQMGQVIGLVKQKTGGAADGALIAKLTGQILGGQK